MKILKSFDLTYCSNIHPGETWQEHFEHIKKTILNLKKKLCPNGKFGLGLRIGNQASEDLKDEKLLNDLKEWLRINNLYVFTLNGFPYGPFHGQMVKERVHQPDWTSLDRVAYTKNLFYLLKELVDVGQEGSISTSPIGYKFNYSEEESKVEAFKKAARGMVDIALLLCDLKTEGYDFHLDIEPEPDGLLENSEDVIKFYRNFLIPIAKEQIQQSGKWVEELIYNHIRVCYDVCHFAVVFENQIKAIENLRDEGIKIGKIQISSALKLKCNSELNELRDDIAYLSKFNEPVYLHQVAIKTNSEKHHRFRDLDKIKHRIIPNGAQELRSHFHVPIFMDDFENISSTQDEIVELLEYIKNKTICNHLEVETYTWSVLPEDYQIDLSSSIERELQWVISQLS